ncbi:hypothetical protein [Halobacterium litoreum]|uniref:Roadblock/LAMTOR2 domain-containing protein n=1 Tax=Halobacterium litoreum TaxID=2039234 RepID=A0ABD5NHL5_9EURY|nr:hypothetical protein [Halobacterium litoreum]UHH12400.1 hypothetical protein LT972_09540 [Halobacterium litoreum]
MTGLVDVDTLDGRTSEELADGIADGLRDAYGDAVVGVGSFEDGDPSVVYRDDALSAAYEPAAIRDILENIQLESLGHTAYEEYHDQPLHATVRVYGSVVTFVVPFSETAGVVAAVRRDRSPGVYDVLDTVEECLP